VRQAIDSGLNRKACAQWDYWISCHGLWYHKNHALPQLQNSSNSKLPLSPSTNNMVQTSINSSYATSGLVCFRQGSPGYRRWSWRAWSGGHGALRRRPRSCRTRWWPAVQPGRGLGWDRGLNFKGRDFQFCLQLPTMLPLLWAWTGSYLSLQCYQQWKQWELTMGHSKT